MDAEAAFLADAGAIAAVSPGGTFWTYRNSIWALPWLPTVRVKLEDPAFAAWFMPFSGRPPYGVPRCDTNHVPPLCSDLYHHQKQTPQYPQGDGNCSAPACDTGRVPAGMYMFNPLAANVSVRGETLQHWYIETYVFGPTGGGSPLVSGFFFDVSYRPHQPHLPP